MYPNCYLSQPPVAHTIAYIPPPPTVTLALTSVPYTGLDMGPIGTFLYWAFLAAWAALGTYLIVIKRVQNSIARRIEESFF